MTDELKPVSCGCGGEARIVYIDGEDSEDTFVECTRCKISVPVCPSEEEAVTAWNKAMGATDMNVGDKERTAKVINRCYNGTALGIVGLADSSYGTCVNCWGDVLDRYTYCPHCGARLEWK